MKTRNKVLELLLKKWVHTSSPMSLYVQFCSAVLPKTGIVWSQMSGHIYSMIFKAVSRKCYGGLLWERITFVHMNKSNSQSGKENKEKILCSVVLRLRFCVEKVSSKHIWFQSPFLFILLSFPTLLLYLFSLLPWLDHFPLQFYLHNHQTCYFFSNFFIFKFYSQRQIWLFCSKIIYFWGASVWKHSIVRSFPYLIIPVPHC